MPIVHEDNLALSLQAKVTVSVSLPRGNGSRDPNVLLNESALHLDNQPIKEFFAARTYDTYDGQNQANNPDWYALEFKAFATVNCLEMTMGIPYRDGGWWTSLKVETYCEEEEAWQSVKNLIVTPSYDFEDRRKQRRPYETYALLFETVTTRRLRLIGMPGGIAYFTSLARIAAYYRDITHWDPTCLPAPPTPQIFRLISPYLFFDLSENLTKLTGLKLDIPYVEYYLDELRFEKHWQMWAHNYIGEPDLWFFLGDSLDWLNWLQDSAQSTEIFHSALQNTSVSTHFYGLLAYAQAPVTVNNRELEFIRTGSVLLKDRFDLSWHQNYAREHQLSWELYKAALDRTPQFSLKQLEGAAGLLGMITSTIVNATLSGDKTENEIEGASKDRHSSFHHKDMVREAITFMQTNVENFIDVAGVASHFGISPSHFCTLFAEQIGCSPGDYLIMLRLERAKRYLAHSHMSVTSVCMRLGYTPSHFSRLFKRYIGCTPRQFVQQTRMQKVAPISRSNF